MDSARARSKEQCIAWKGGKASQRAGSDGSEGRGEGGGSVPGQPEMGNPDAPPTAGKCSPDTYKGTLAVQQNECPVMFQCIDQGNCTANDSEGSEGREEGGGSVPGQPERGNPDAPPPAGKCSPDTYKGTLAVQQNECPVMFQCSDQGNCTANDSCTANDVGGDDVLLLHLSRRVVQTSDFTNWDACLL